LINFDSLRNPYPPKNTHVDFKYEVPDAMFNLSGRGRQKRRPIFDSDESLNIYY